MQLNLFPQKHPSKPQPGTRRRRRSRLLFLTILLAGAGLWGLGRAGAPMTTTGGINYTEYRESGDGMYIRSPLFWLLTPLGEKASLEMSGTVDTISGASPRYDAISAASMVENRRGADVKLTGYGEEFDLGAKLSLSSENDYKSTGLGLDGRWYLNNKNTALNLGLGYATDNFDSGFFTGSIHSREVLLGVTQELTPTDIVQTSLSYTRDNGLLSDVRKYTLVDLGFVRINWDDRRPETHHKWAWLTRYNHHFPTLDASSHIDYRLYRDSWGITAHTVDLAWYQQLGEYWTVRPSLRYHAQSAADFYVTVITDDALLDGPISSDYRLSQFGALTPGLKIICQLTENLSVNLKGEYYKQDNAWYPGGDGNSATPMEASIFTVGLAFSF